MIVKDLLPDETFTPCYLRLLDGEVVSPFTAALLQRGRALRSPRMCPHCRTRLMPGEELIDLRHHGIRCEHCPKRRK